MGVNLSLVANGEPVMVDACDERTFASGSRGYFLGGKATIGGKRYQVTANIVEIGSKPA